MVLLLCAEVRAQAIPLTDAFGISDALLQSVLGRYDGDVYNAYLNLVKSIPNG